MWVVQSFGQNWNLNQDNNGISLSVKFCLIAYFVIFSYESLAEMAIDIFTTTSPEFWDPSQWCLLSTAVISSKIFLAMSQNLLNFVFFCIVFWRFVWIFYAYFNSFIVLCLLIIFWFVIVACNFTVNKSKLGWWYFVEHDLFC